jgi:hypothetical protein
MADMLAFQPSRHAAQAEPVAVAIELSAEDHSG